MASLNAWSDVNTAVGEEDGFEWERDSGEYVVSGDGEECAAKGDPWGIPLFSACTWKRWARILTRNVRSLR